MRTWSLSITTRLSALTCFFTSLLLLAAAGAAAPPDPTKVAALELEVSLARRPELYLVLDATSRTLEVKARGVTLDIAAVSGLEVITRQPLLGGQRPPSLSLPAIWTVEKGAGDIDREVIAPTELRPYSESDDEDSSPRQTPPPGVTPTPEPTATPVPEPPASYRATTDNGWELWIRDRLPPQGLLVRFLAAVHDGWRRLRGNAPEAPPALVIVLRPEDARRFHHLLRKGRAVLLLP
jgi:hypothetical protein